MGRTTAKIKPTKKKVNLAELSVQQLQFVQAMMADPEFCANRAAKAAGYSHPHIQSARLLNSPIIQAALGREIYERAQRLGITKDDVLDHLRTALFLDPATFFEFNEDGSWTAKSLNDIPLEVRRCITEIKAKRTVRKRKGGIKEVELTYELKFMSKDRALELAMKHLGLLENKLQVSGQVTVDFLNSLVDTVEGHAVVIGREAIEG